MPPIIKETDAAAAPEPGAARDNIQARQQTVALEVPVTVNGGRAIEGSDQREQFSESTKTVLVHGNGAVIRLNSPVTPGQLLFLTNERTKKEIVCQVVKSKSHDHLSGYVELEFTEAVAGFWGMRFPGERSAAQPRAATPIPTATRSIEAELEPLSAAPSAAEMARAQYGQEGKKDASQFTGLVTGQAKHVPFTAELKSDERGTTQAGFLESAPSANATPLDRESLAAQEEVSSPDPVVDVVPQSFKEASSGTVAAPPSALKDQEFASAATKLFEMAQPDSSPNKLEPSSNLFDLPAKQENVQIEPSLKVEEVKVPAWLEPVARSAAPAAPKKDEATDLAPLSEKPDESEDAKPKKSAATSVVRQPRRAEPQIPVFRTTVLDHHTPSAPEPVASGGMNKGAWILGAAAIVVFAAAGVTWYLRQPMEPQAPPNPLSAATLPITSASTVASSPMPTNVPDVQAAQSAAPVEIRSAESTASSGANAESRPAGAQVLAQPAVLSEPVRKASTNDVPVAPPDAEPASSRPSLGKVRLAKPKAVRRASTDNSTIAEPSIDGDQTAPASDSLGAGLVTGSTEPARPVGGNAAPAKLLSSVPPVYPQAARAQHVSGDVQIDALIDAKGRVSSMKVLSGPPQLQLAAKDALRQWKYQPATLNGTSVPMHLTVTIQFRLE